MCNLPRNTAQSVTQQKEKDYSKGPINPWWQGWLDSNQRMRESKSLALPLGYTPVCVGSEEPTVCYHTKLNFTVSPLSMITS